MSNKPVLNKDARKLKDELQERLQLSDSDALRATFVVLAYEKGWSQARIGRYLGVTRHRIHQRIARYEAYSGAKITFPVLASHINGRKRPAQVPRGEPGVAAKPEDWDNVEFAVEMINRVAA